MLTLKVLCGVFDHQWCCWEISWWVGPCFTSKNERTGHEHGWRDVRFWLQGAVMCIQMVAAICQCTKKKKKTIRLQANVKGAGFMRRGMAVNMFVKP